MSLTEFFSIELKEPVCLKNLSEDELRTLVRSLLVTIADPDFAGFVRSTRGAEVKYNFPDGNFQGVTARINGQDIVIIPGVKDKGLGLFEGPPNETNPGAGWEVDALLTQRYLNQPPVQADWEMFVARRVAVLNNP